MLFNSSIFFAFYAAFFPLYWLVHRNRRLRTSLVLVASYVFYGAWDWRFLSLIVASTVVDFYCGRAIAASSDQKRRKRLLFVSLGVNLGALGFFKYYGFFVQSFIDFANALGWHPHPATLSIILPVGISFYTFQTLSYTIDIYRRELEPTDDFIAFAAFVAFFPQLVAGPIERARRLLPQIVATPKLDAALLRDGVMLILWGLFKKVLIADRIAVYVDTVYAEPGAFSPLQCTIATLLFAFQIYMDFSGYSDIARGLGKTLGIELVLNFRSPYFATSLRDFWHRWHISLSTWFRDYVYIPLGGSRGNDPETNRNLLITFLLSGLWHGANYTFVFWGLLHGLGVIVDPLTRLEKRRGKLNWREHRFAVGFGWLWTFLLVNAAWTFFRADTIGNAWVVLKKIAHLPMQLWESPGMPEILAGLSRTEFVYSCYLLLIAAGLDFVSRKHDVNVDLGQHPTAVRWVLSWALIVHLLLLGPSDTGSFIYFQF
jgi:D-alanyl-lipoteichoic acid acyltransferase DltB (MBOAT superfamily)